MPVSSCSAPIGSWIATQRSRELLAAGLEGAEEVGALAVEHVDEDDAREPELLGARPDAARVHLDAHDAADDDERALDDPQRAGRVGLEAGVAGRVDHVDLAALPLEVADRRGERHRAACCSSSSQSETVEPWSIAPSRLIAPAWKSSASVSEVFPVPRWPTTATLRILPGSTAAMRTPPPGDVGAVAGSYDGSGPCREARPRGLGARLRAEEARLEAEDRLRVQLRDARLGDAEHLADLAQGQLLVVVERDDELLALGQARDRLAERLAELGLRRARPAGSGPSVSSIVSSSETWSPPSPETVQSSSSAAIDEREISVRLSSSSSTVIPTLAAISSSSGARPSFDSSSRDRALDLARAGAHRARHPVERAQLVDDRALDPRDRVGLELDVAGRVEALDRADQAEQAVRDEVALVDVRRQPAAEPARRRT